MKRTYIYALHDPRDWRIVYVGKSNRPKFRLQMHRRWQQRSSRLKKLTSELNASGLNLQMTILQRCNLSEWEYWEKFWITTVRQAEPNILNLTDGGNGCTDLNEEWRKNIAVANIGRKHSPETRAKLRASRLGRKFGPLSKETRAKISASNMGKRHSLETIARLSQAAKNRTDKRLPAWNKGTKNTEEYCKKMSDKLKGRHISKEHRQKISAAKTGVKRRPFTKQALKNMSAAHKGLKRPPEVCAKISRFAKLRERGEGKRFI